MTSECILAHFLLFTVLICLGKTFKSKHLLLRMKMTRHNICHTAFLCAPYSYRLLVSSQGSTTNDAFWSDYKGGDDEICFKIKKLDQAIVHVTPALFCLARLKEKKRNFYFWEHTLDLTHQKVQIWKTILSKIDQSFDPYFLLFKVWNEVRNGLFWDILWK